jgi:hypothetical protein
MVTIKINGTSLVPQPMEANWISEVIDGKLNGTDATGAYQIFKIATPRNRSSNWDDYENQVLTSLQAFAPGDTPNGASVLYSAGVVSRKIREYSVDINRTVMAEMEILVIV